MRLRFLTRLLFVLLNAAAVAQTSGPPPSPTPQPQTKAAAEEVVLDFVARDSHSRLVGDLRPEEIRITDGGSAVKIARLQFVGGNGHQAAAQQRLVSFVFDSLDAYNAPAARKAAAGMLGSLAGTGAVFSVWRIGDKLELVQPFTKDADLLNRAIETAVSPQRPALAPAVSVPPGGYPLVVNAQRTVERWEQVQRDEKLRPPVSALVALARQQAELKGRKAIIYFSDGVQAEACPPDQLRTAIGSANRAGVVLYTANVGGLSEAAEKKASSILEATAPVADSKANPPAADPAATAAKQAGATTLQFTFIQLDADLASRTPLRSLAESTGGFYIRRASELGSSAGKIADDLTSYYEVTYPAPQQERNGQFRPVSIRVSRPQTRLQFRSGYFALPAGAPLDAPAYEVPLIKALNAPERTETIPFRIDVLHLGPSMGKARGEAVLELPLSAIECKVDPALGLCDMHFSMVAWIKDAQGQVLQRFSQDVSDQLAAEGGAESARNGTYTFQRSFILPPGEYRLEAAVLDRVANKLSSKTSSVTLSASSDLAVSDLFLVRTVEPLWSKADAEDPLRYQDGRVVPVLIPVWRGADRDVQSYFLVTTDPKIATPPRVLVEVQKDGKVLERPAIKVVDRRPGAPIPVTAMLKRSLLDPGHYQLVVKLTQGKNSVERKLNFEVVTKPAPIIPDAVIADAAKAGGEAGAIAAMLDVKLIEGIPKPEDEEVQRIIASAREKTADYRSALPDFICTRTTTKFSGKKDTRDWTPALSATDLMQYVEGEEKTQTLTSKQVANMPSIMRKLDLVGELGGALSLVFNPDHAAQIDWKGMAEVKGVRVHVFQYRVERKNSGYRLSLGEMASQPLTAYRGIVLIDAGTLAVRRVVVEAVDIPKDFPIRQSAFSVDYDFVRIGGKRFLVPQHSTWVYLGNNQRPMMSDRVFQNYRKYTTTSGIKYMGEAGKHEAGTTAP